MTDILLEWMSFRVSGRDGDLPREIVADERPLRILRDFSALGHAEIEPNGSWRIAPPVLAMTESEETGACKAVLCGARSPRLLQRLESACARTDTDCIEQCQVARPSVYAVIGTCDADLMAAAAEAKIPFQRDAAFTLLACLPKIRDWPRTECPMVAGRVGEVSRFSRSQLTWIASSLEEAAQARRGFFRIQRDWDHVHLLKQGANSQAQIEPRAGRLAAAERAKVVRWDIASRSLRMPWALYPPALIARALVLCSGKLPETDTDSRELVFQNVPVRITQMLLAITGLKPA